MDQRQERILRAAFLVGAITDAFALLLWARRHPLERSFVAALTVFVIYGLVTTEIVAVRAGYLPASRMIPTWLLQAGLLALFSAGYHYPWLHRRVAA